MGREKGDGDESGMEMRVDIGWGGVGDEEGGADQYVVLVDI